MLHLSKIILLISLSLLLINQFSNQTKSTIPSSGNTIVDTSAITYPIYNIIFNTNSIDTAATGSDIWATTWLANNNQWTIWGDGGGFNGSDDDCRTNHGQGLISGDYGSHTFSNLVNGCSPTYTEPQFESGFGYPWGCQEVDGVMYFWRSGDNENPYGTPTFRQELWKSTNGGDTWIDTGVGWDKPNDFGGNFPTLLTNVFVQYDKGTVVGRGDGYIYSTWSKIDSVPGAYRISQIFLMRVHRDSMETKAAYSYLASSTPTWTYTIGNAVPIFDGGTVFNLIDSDVSMLFHPLFKRYVLTFYNDRFTPSNCELIILNSNLMWNRNWVTAYRENPFDKGLNFGSKAVYSNFSQKWMSDTSGVMIYVSHSDNFATIEVDFDSNANKTVSVNEISDALHEFALKQSYPNPFNPVTKISWFSPVNSWQTLKVYDINGNVITTLVDEYRPAGNYEIEFDGSGLSSGVYFYKFQAGEFSDTKKLILLR